MVVPVVVGASLAVLNWAAAGPGRPVGRRLPRLRRLDGASASAIPTARSPAFSAMVMHFAWSAGFWLQLLDFRKREASHHDQASNSGPRLRIDICVCTYRRPELDETLRSLAAQWPAERDGADHRRRQRRRAERAGSVSNALRGARAVRDRLCALPGLQHLDRPQCLPGEQRPAISSPSSTMTRPRRTNGSRELDRHGRRRPGADAVLGPVRAVYCEARAALDEAEAISIRRARSGSVARSAPATPATCLLRRAPRRPLPAGASTLRCGSTGGEDTEYFTQLHEAGGRIAFAPQAGCLRAACRPTAPRFSWLTKRRFSVGQTHGRLLAEQGCEGWLLPRDRLAVGKSGLLLRGLRLARRSRPATATAICLRGVMHAGAVSGLAGMREIQLYGQLGSTTR